jgi:hypothetical protein
VDIRHTPLLAALRHVISVEDGGDLTLESLAGRGGEVPAARVPSPIALRDRCRPYVKRLSLFAGLADVRLMVI